MAKHERKSPYMKLWKPNWRDGTRMLSYEAKGFYMDIVLLLDDGEDVPSDTTELATFLQCNPRTCRKILPDLIATGKLFAQNGLLHNPRFDAENALQNRIDPEVKPNSVPIEPEFSANSAPIQRQFEPNKSKTPTKTRAEKKPSLREKREERRERTIGVSAGASAKDIFEKLTEVAGEAIYPLAIAMQAVSEPIGWIADGADLEIDIVPTVQALCAKAQDGSIRSWGYFRQAVADAKARRERGLPDAQSVSEPAGVIDFQKHMREAVALSAARAEARA